LPWNLAYGGELKRHIFKLLILDLYMTFKKGQTPWNKGKHPSEETIKKQSESWMKTYLSNPKVRKRMS
jgi:hypothetical protein